MDEDKESTRGEGAGLTLAGVFESGDGRVAEVVSSWLAGLGATPTSLARDTGGLEDTPTRQLVERAAQFWPGSASVPVLAAHLGWTGLQTWTREAGRAGTGLAELLVASHALSCPALRCRYLGLAWRAVLQPVVRDCARTTEQAAARPEADWARLAEEAGPGAGPVGVATWLGQVAALLDCQLQSLALTGEEGGDGVAGAGYDRVCPEPQQHLLDHVAAGPLPDMEVVSLQQQLCLVLELAWQLRLPTRPSHLFNTAERAELLAHRPGLMAGLFSDPNTGVRRRT